MLNKYMDTIEKAERVLACLVIGYAILYMALTLWVCMPRILAQYSTADVSQLAESFELPLDIFATGLLVVTALYTGIDRGALISKSFNTESCDMGKPGRIIIMLILLFLIFAETATLNFFFSKSWDVTTECNGEWFDQTFRGVDLPTENVVGALVTTFCFYIGGNKAILNVKKTQRRKKK